MSKGTDTPASDDGTLLKLAKILTAIWLICLAAFVILKWPKIVLLEPNAVGDFLAGAFAPLAFSWLVVAVFLQREELQAQRRELEQNREALLLQAQELKNAVDQYSQQTKILALNREGDDRKELERTANEQLDHLAKFCMDQLSAIGVMVTPPNNSQQTIISYLPNTATKSQLIELRAKSDWDAILIVTLQTASRFLKKLESQQSQINKLSRIGGVDELQGAISHIVSINGVISRVPDTPAETRSRIVHLTELENTLTRLKAELEKLPPKT